jgi:hypothetical protein
MQCAGLVLLLSHGIGHPPFAGPQHDGIAAVNPRMSTISSLFQLQAATPYQAPSSRSGSAVQAAAAAPSAVVKLSKEGLAAAGESAQTPVTTAMRYKDLGAELLAAFKTGAIKPATDAAIPDDVDNRFALGVTTASGRKVDLVLANLGDEMFVRVDADADLGEDEREALAGLAKGFQAAIDGMAIDPPRIRLGELARLDPLLESIALRADVTLPGEPPQQQSLDLQIDANRRSLAIDGPRGALSLGIDTGKLELLGTKQQQARAIDTYLKGFDHAVRRGHGNTELATMFKDAFSDLSRTSNRDAIDTGMLAGERKPLSKVDRAVLTGLADFEASVTEAPRQTNPARREEVTGFHYALSQATRMEEKDARRSLSQVQNSQLKAQFHEALNKGDLPAFDFRSETQNYRYHEIDDSASSTVSLGYKDGRLTGARMEQSLNESQRVRKYVLGRLMSDETIPDQYVLVRDLMEALAPYQPGQTEKLETDDSREERYQGTLDALNEELVLLGTRLELADRDARL